MRGISALVMAGALTTVAPATATAFCGFYVGGAGADLYNDASVVVMMRHGTTTVLSMQNNYQGPPRDFAMVVPVPVVLDKKQVKTLPRDVFRKVDAMAAPRLVEYWERDPCLRLETRRFAFAGDHIDGRLILPDGLMLKRRVTVHSRFEVDEYEIVVLGATDSGALESWLRRHNYAIPRGAKELLRPYVASGMKFFVAKVDASKVQTVGGKTMLSPLRFYYQSKRFNLPIRLGLLSSKGTQDLLVHVLADRRYEVANYDNVTIPTNLPIAPEAKGQFGAFYAALFDHVVSKHKGAVVTEYAWDARTCDPCPGPALSRIDLFHLGLDVVPALRKSAGPIVLTRLHARYSKGALGDDLVFREAPPIAGGREHQTANGRLERGATKGAVNNFQGRYIIRHPWTGPIECKNPRRGRWDQRPGRRARAATNIAAAPRGQVSVKSLLRRSLAAEDTLVVRGDRSLRSALSEPSVDRKGGCAGCASTTGGAVPILLALMALLATRRRG